MKTTHFCVLIHCSADCWLFPQAICPSPQKIALKTIENNRKIGITKEICITIDSPKKVPRRKPDSEAGCIFENFTPKQGNSLKILAAGTRNHGVSLSPPSGYLSSSDVSEVFVSGVSSLCIFLYNELFEFLFVMFNQKRDFSFCETLITIKSDVIFPFVILISRCGPLFVKAITEN